MMTDTLYLHEQLMLLMLRDDSGTMESHTEQYQLALGGALLAELMLRGAVRIGTDKKSLVEVVRKDRLPDPLLEECVELVSASKRPYGAAVWVSRFGGLRKLRHRIAEGLCRRGILEDSEDKVLFFFTRSIYPTINAVPERRLIESLRDAVLGSAREVAPDVALLVTLGDATGLLSIHFDKAELKRAKGRIEEITSGQRIGSATAAAVEAAQQAMQAAVLMSIIATTVVINPSC